ncbi:MAG: hypothetical protein PWR10_2196 [Halanaerobiales bacterium]|nr:hypothetical protein [Halanaerobiales bacterium]
MSDFKIDGEIGKFEFNMHNLKVNSSKVILIF